jgi:multidrug efflux pump subunit AcrA (membrane-fusion protein)
MNNNADNHSETEGLEPQQYERLYWEADVPVRDLRLRLLRRLLYAGVVLFAGICAAAALVRFPNQVELPFVLKNDVREEVYKFPYTVYLLEQYVQTGDSVQAGDPLLRITSPEIVALINRYNEAGAGRDNFYSARMAAALRQREIIQDEIRQNLLGVEEQRRQLELARRTWTAHERELRFALQDAADKLQDAGALFESNTVSRYELIERENRKVQAENALSQEKLRFEKDSARMAAQISQLLLDNQTAETRLAKWAADLRSDSLETGSRYELARRRIADSFGDCVIADGAIMIKSAASGRVSFLFEGEKEIRAGVTALKLNNAGSPLFAFAKCPPAMAGKLRDGQDCHLKVHSFPFYEYGAARGHIRRLSFSPDEKGDYNLHIALDHTGRLQGWLQPGLTGAAVIIIEEKTLLQYFFRGLKKQYHRVVEGI